MLGRVRKEKADITESGSALKLRSVDIKEPHSPKRLPQSTQAR
jgi:hypothetical protein